MMKRRALFPILALAIAWGGQVRAEEPVERILNDLKRLGYQNVSVESTLLRRTRILAQSDEALREIIVNPNTGEILRDLWTPIKKASSKGSGGILDDDSNSGSGSGSGSDDDDDDNDEDGDNSGSGGGGDDDGGGDDSGGGNSGSGSGGDGGGDDGDDD